MRSVLVSGGAGFIGSHLVDGLLAAGDRVRVLDDFSTGDRQNLAHTDVEVIEGDIRDEQTLAVALEGVTHVLHQAALPSVARSVKDPLATHDVNITGTLRLLEAARRAGVVRFVQASSSSVYGDQEGTTKAESMTPRPLSPYAVSKLTAEHYARVYHLLYGMETVSLRYFNVFGPRQSASSEYSAVIPLFMDALSNHREPVIFGDGEQSRDFTYVANIVNLNLLALSSPGVGGRVFNGAAGCATSVNELALSLGGLFGRHVQPVHEAPRPADVRHSLASLDDAKAALGYKPGVPFKEGLKLTLDAFGS